MNDDLIDGQLVKNALDGDNSSFDVLVKRYSGNVRMMLEKRNVVFAEDILQDAFVKAYLNLSKFDEKYSFGGWVMTIAKNLSIDSKRKITPSSDGALPIEGVNIPSLSPDPEQLVVRTQQAQRLEVMMGKLPDNYRQILNLRFDEELSYEEISQKLELPIGTVKTQIHRARQALMALMEM